MPAAPPAHHRLTDRQIACVVTRATLMPEHARAAPCCSSRGRAATVWRPSHAEPTSKPMSAMRIFVSHAREDDPFCRALVAALRMGGADVWFDEQHGPVTEQMLPAFELELRARAVFIVVLSPYALVSPRVRTECTWAYTCFRADPTRVLLPVLAQPIEATAVWLFLDGFRRLGISDTMPFPAIQAIQRTLHALCLTPHPEPAALGTADWWDKEQDFLIRGNALGAQGRYADALPFLQQAAHVAPHSPNAWYSVGQACMHLPAQRYAEALVAYDRAVALDPDFALAWASKAKTLNALRRYEEALAACETAIVLVPGSAFAWNNKGVALFNLRRYPEAVSAYETAVTCDPNSADFWRNKGLALAALGRDPEALVAYDRALDVDPNFALAWASKANALYRLRRFEEALSTCERALALDPKSAQVWSRQGSILAALRHFPEALAACDQALALDPTLPAAWSNRGGALAALERYNEALAALDRALVLAPDFAGAWHNEVVLLRAWHRDAEADLAEARVRALGLDAGDEWSPESEDSAAT